jgi:hypothetical protein
MKLYSIILLFILTISCQRPEKKEEPPKPKTFALTEERERNPFGSVLVAQRTKDTFVENVGQVATYRFITRKFPTETRYLLATQNLGKPLTPYAWYDPDDEGQLGRQLDLGTLMLDQELFLMFDYCRGEPVEYWLCSSDSKARLCVELIPYPIKTEGRDGASVTLKRLTQNAALLLLEGFDFDPDEQIVVSTQVGNNHTPNVPITCTYGRFSMLLEPSCPGKSGGVGYVDVVRLGERLSLDFDWGSEATNPKKRLGNTSKIQQDALIKLPTD